jgi:protease I
MDNITVAVICQGPWTVIATGYAKGKKIASWPSLKTDLQNAGTQWMDQEVMVDDKTSSGTRRIDLRRMTRAMHRNWYGSSTG